MSAKKVASDAADLLAAASDPSVDEIAIQGKIAGAPTLRLRPQQQLTGSAGSAIAFRDGSDGVCLSSGNCIRDIHLATSPIQRAIFNDTTVSDLGTIALRGITAVGQVQILARDKVRAGRVEVDGLDIIAADARGQQDRPNGYGVYVIQGAFTLWNMQPSEEVTITCDLRGISVGRDGAPVFGSGIFVSGAGDTGGRIKVACLETAAVYSDGKIAPGTPDQITGGVFTVYGSDVDVVHNLGPVVTYGVNDMALDNWGRVVKWTAEKKITSHGPSGIGFVNFGTVKELRVNAPIETFGQGARGFNVYTGTVELAEFERIETRADGAVGIQISRPIGKIHVRRGIETFGGTGDHWSRASS